MRFSDFTQDAWGLTLGGGLLGRATQIGDGLLALGGVVVAPPGTGGLPIETSLGATA